MLRFFIVLSILFSLNSAKLFAQSTTFTQGYLDVSDDYFLEFDLSKKECDEIIDEDLECFRRDFSRDNPYYHKTTLKIYNKKIVIEQFFKNSEFKTDRIFLKAKNGTFRLKTNKKTFISFTAEGGKILELKWLNGLLSKENKNPSNCVLNEFLYAYYQTYDKTRLLTKNIFYKNPDNFKGVKELIIFRSKAQFENSPSMALHNLSLKSQNSVVNIDICKIEDEEEFIERSIGEKECLYGKVSNLAKCSKFKDCENYLEIRNCRVWGFAGNFDD
jgi:hypothetical protein